MAFVKSIPKNANPKSILTQFPESGRYIAEFTEVLLRGPSSLTPAERELIAAYVSGLNGCEFCFVSHAKTAEALGIDKDLADSIVKDVETAGCEEKMKPILYYVRKLTQTPAEITQEDVDSVFAAGWNEEAFYHVVSICGLFNYYNRLIEGYGIELTPGYVGSIGDFLATHGYANMTTK